jgi:hypothetical protein
MVAISQLWLPILVSSVLVFVVSSIIHMVLPYHKGDFRAVPAQDDVQEALRKFNIPPGDYMLPRATSMNDMKSPEFLEKLKKGPVAVMTVLPSGQWNMGKSLTLWFLFSLAVGGFAAYVAGRALGPGATYLSVFRFAGVTAFIAYAVGGWPQSIWYNRAWSTTIKHTFDGLVYGLVTGGAFGWLWPK